MGDEEAKTVRDYIFDGGIGGRLFIERATSFVYEIESLDSRLSRNVANAQHLYSDVCYVNDVEFQGYPGPKIFMGLLDDKEATSKQVEEARNRERVIVRVSR